MNYMATTTQTVEVYRKRSGSGTYPIPLVYRDATSVTVAEGVLRISFNSERQTAMFPLDIIDRVESTRNVREQHN